MTRTAWFHCFAGTAGDMTLGALVAAGADPRVIADTLSALPLDGYSLRFDAVQRCGIAATHAVVAVAGEDHERGDHDAHLDDDGHDHAHHDHADDDHGDHAHTHPHRPYREIRALLAAAVLPPRVLDRAQRTFRTLAEAEGLVHRMDADDVELHEVGSVDAIVDVVGTCAALESLGVDRIVCSTIAVGEGHVRAAHGELPNPAPAVVELLARRGAPTRGIADRRELATPTGVALMVALADEFGPLPPLTVTAVGYGAGTRDTEGRPNVVQVVIGEESISDQGPGQQVLLVECNVDDVTGEVIAHTIDALLRAGAHDAWATPIVMKKGRPAHTVSALCDPSQLDFLRAVMVGETGSLGVRATTLTRWPQQRTESTVTIDGHVIRIKLAGGRIKVENDDAVAAATALGLPLRDVLERAVAAARQRS